MREFVVSKGYKVVSTSKTFIDKHNSSARGFMMIKKTKKDIN